jgi:hypothetical protein
MLGGPAHRGERVFDSRRVGMLRRTAELNRGQDHTGGLAEKAAEGIVGRNRAGNPAAAVKIDQHWQRLGAGNGQVEACG